MLNVMMNGTPKAIAITISFIFCLDIMKLYNLLQISVIFSNYNEKDFEKLSKCIICFESIMEAFISFVRVISSVSPIVWCKHNFIFFS